MNELEQMKEAYKDMLENISLEQFEEYKKELTNNTYCVICKEKINGDSQFVKGKWYHNDCIENLNNIINKIQKELEANLKYKVIGVRRLQTFITDLIKSERE
ncbi:MAG: hypothetical protein J6T23_02555 [Elusimicrobia bacterium]|nr:hypothetical protein [Elusimicrobiota bacterium]